MGSRRDVQFQLLTENISEDEKIPPLVLLTLIENGLSHAYSPRENGTFWLSFKQDNHVKQYILKNDGSQLKKFSQKKISDIEEGLGLSYIKARLEESFPGKWKIEYGMNGGFWETKIRLEK
jgi:LytS/YehU family sensor histidine kinase